MAKVRKRARKFIGRTIRRLAHRGERAPRRVAIALAKARRRGFRVPKARANPKARKAWSERQAWREVGAIAAGIAGALARGGKAAIRKSALDYDAATLAELADRMLRQLGRGVHENPLLGVVGNPPKGARKLATRVYELRYRHAQGRHENFRHPFRAGAEAFCLPGGAILIRHRRGLPLWKDFPDAR